MKLVRNIDQGGHCYNYSGLFGSVGVCSDRRRGPSQHGFDFDSKVQIFETIIRDAGGLLVLSASTA